MVHRLTIVAILLVAGTAAAGVVWRGQFLSIRFPRWADYPYWTYDATDDMRKKADAGDAEAQFQYGALLAGDADGAPGPHLDYLMKAAEAGHPTAENEIGNAYAMGLWGLLRDERAAMSWFEKSAAKGEPVAQYNLATIYRNGDFVDHDDERTAALYLASAVQGYAASQFNYHLLVREGAGARRNPLVAWRAETAASRGGYGEPQFASDNLQLANGMKLGGARRAAAAYAEQSRNLAQAIRCAALFGDLSSIREVEPRPGNSPEVKQGAGELSSIGDVVDYLFADENPSGPSLDAAVARTALLSVASKLGDPVAQERLAAAYTVGDGVSRSETQANYWRRRSERNPLKEQFPGHCATRIEDAANSPL